MGVEMGMHTWCAFPSEYPSTDIQRNISSQECGHKLGEDNRKIKNLWIS